MYTHISIKIYICIDLHLCIYTYVCTYTYTYNRLDMMQQYDDKIQALLEVFEKKMQQNTVKCEKALSGTLKCSHLVEGMRYNA